MLRRVPTLSVELEDERRVRFDPDDQRSAGFVQVLARMRSLHVPVYVEINPDTSAITYLRVPLVSRVTDVRQVDDDLTVTLERSHARHVLKRTDPGFDDLERRAREALRARTPIILTEDDAHEIIDIRNYSPGPEGRLPPFPDEPEEPELPPQIPPPRNLFEGLMRPLWVWRWLFSCISSTEGQLVFNAMSATSCDPLSISTSCIPFLYPDDGCWARAHEMCRLMKNMGLNPKKVWIQGDLVVSTKNNPTCSVGWNWHVAPTLCVRGPGFLQTQDMVIDPSLFTAPVSKATWKSVQGDPTATLTDTDDDVYYLIGGTDYDPNYSKTSSWLAYFRTVLQTRVIQYGPPPYANCP
jgi:Glutaminase